MAKQIDIMGFSNLNLGVHCDFHYQTYNLLTKAGAEALHIAALLPANGGQAGSPLPQRAQSLIMKIAGDLNVSGYVIF